MIQRIPEFPHVRLRQGVLVKQRIAWQIIKRDIDFRLIWANPAEQK